MGLLDQLGNLNPEQTQGLLAAAAQMLQQSGPSRMPTSLGQIAGGGLLAYQGASDEARRRKLEEEQMRQAAQMRGLQMQGLQGELSDKDLQRKQALDAQNFYAKFNKDRNEQSGPTAFAQSVLGSNLAPTVENGAALDLARQNQGGTHAAPAGGAGSIFSQRLAQADAMRRTGNPMLIQRADDLEKSALSFQPKVKSWEKVQVGDRVLLKPYFEDGAAGDPVPADVAEKLEFRSTGQKTLGLNPFTGKQQVSFQNTQDPNSIASLAQSERHFQAEQNNPTYMDTMDGIMALPKRLKPGAAPVGQPVMGQNGEPLEKKQNVPQYVVQGITNNAKSLASIDAALASLKTDAGKDAVGMKAYLPNAALNRLYPDGTETRANIADVGSLILHDRSGAAVTAAESPRLMPFIPLATDDAVTAEKKLKRFRQVFESETNNLTFQFPQAKKLADYAASQKPAAGAETPGDISDLLKKYGGQ